MDKLISKRETPLQDWMGSLINSIANFNMFYSAFQLLRNVSWIVSSTPVIVCNVYNVQIIVGRLGLRATLPVGGS